MKKRIWTSAFREVKNSRSRFFSILSIVAIGVGFFGGVRATGPDMVLSADTYYHEANLSDFRLVSTAGFSQADVEALQKLPGLSVYASQFTDCIEKAKDADKVVRVYALDAEPAVNRPVLLSGRLPENDGECIVDGSGFHGSASLGGVVTFEGDRGADLSDTLARTQYTVVGTFESPLYLSATDRGSTTVGDGSVDDIVYVPAANFKADYYTQIYLTADDLAACTAYSDAYDTARDAWADRLQTTADGRCPLRLAELKEAYDARLADAKQEIADGERQLADGEGKLADGQKQLDEAAAKLADSRTQLSEAKTTLDDGKAALTSGQSALDSSIAGAYAQYNQALAAYHEKKSEMDTALEQAAVSLEAAGASAGAQLAALRQLIAAIDWNAPDYTALSAAVAASSLPDSHKQTLAALLTQPDPAAVKAGLAQYLAVADAAATAPSSMATGLRALKNDADPAAGIDAAASLKSMAQSNAGALGDVTALLQLFDAYPALMQAKAQLDALPGSIEAVRVEKQAALDAAAAKLSEGEKSYQTGLSTYEQGRADYEKALADFTAQKTRSDADMADARQKLSDAKEKVAKAESDRNSLAQPKWYIFDRDDYSGYAEYGENADRIVNIAKIFPVLFLLVAALVCLTTMGRMVEEQRTQIGTLKALGYSDGVILAKYMLYALSATLVGAALGLAVGFQLFPRIIIASYAILYRLPVQRTPFCWPLAGLSAGAAAVCIVLTVWSSCRAECVQLPSRLMRPKTPPKGKRILLERIPFLWNRFNFSGKVSARNIFRYKKRMLMAVIGIAGCTALIVTGFALRDSITNIVRNQFDRIWTYQATVAFSENADDDDLAAVNDSLARADSNASSLRTMQKTYTAETEKTSLEATVLVPEKWEELTRFISLQDRCSREKYTPGPDEVIVTEKMATLLGLSTGDTLTLRSEGGAEATVTVGRIAENYAYHYIYMSPATYARVFGESAQWNSVLCRYEGLDAAREATLSETLLENTDVVQVALLSSTSSKFGKVLSALNIVVVVLIVSAGALAFVVLYNLTNININERIREIATLKVLGFRDREVSAYIFRENAVLTLLGTVCGLFLGRWMSMTVITTAEINMVMFGRDISPLSYLYAALITAGFSVLVALFMHRGLRRISMVESLKSVE